MLKDFFYKYMTNNSRPEIQIKVRLVAISDHYNNVTRYKYVGKKSM